MVLKKMAKKKELTEDCDICKAKHKGVYFTEVKGKLKHVCEKCFGKLK
jgi:hypothetical protein